MGDRRGAAEMAMVGDEPKDGENLLERLFSVGEVVEFWEGSSVRGDRTDSGSPAFVKRVEGNGVYAIKMVGSSRGKFRICGWKSLFKDGSLNKNVARRDGARVRGDARLREMARDEAEAKFGEALKETKRDLKQVEKRNREKEKESENMRKREDVVARMAEREREKTESKRLEKHKRQLEELGKEMEQDFEENNRDTRQRIRELRQELQLQGEELQLARHREVQLEEKVIKEQRLKERHKTAGETWQARCKEKTDSGERVIVLEGGIKTKTRELATLEKRNETTCKMLEQEILLLLQKRDQQAQVLSVCLYTIFVFFIRLYIKGR